MDWFRFRLYTSPHVKDSRVEIDRCWDVLDALDMHEAIDVLEDVQILARDYGKTR